MTPSSPWTPSVLKNSAKVPGSAKLDGSRKHPATPSFSPSPVLSASTSPAEFSQKFISSAAIRPSSRFRSAVLVSVVMLPTRLCTISGPNTASQSLSHSAGFATRAVLSTRWLSESTVWKTALFSSGGLPFYGSSTNPATEFIPLSKMGTRSTRFIMSAPFVTEDFPLSEVPTESSAAQSVCLTISDTGTASDTFTSSDVFTASHGPATSRSFPESHIFMSGSVFSGSLGLLSVAFYGSNLHIASHRHNESAAGRTAPFLESAPGAATRPGTISRVFIQSVVRLSGLLAESGIGSRSGGYTRSGGHGGTNVFMATDGQRTHGITASGAVTISVPAQSALLLGTPLLDRSAYTTSDRMNVSRHATISLIFETGDLAESDAPESLAFSFSGAGRVSEEVALSDVAWIETLYLCNTSGVFETEQLMPTDIDAFTAVFVGTRAASPRCTPSRKTDDFSASAMLPEGESGRKGDTDFLHSFWLWVVVAGAAVLMAAGAFIAIRQLRQPPDEAMTAETDSVSAMPELPEDPIPPTVISFIGDMRCDFENPMPLSIDPDTLELQVSEFSSAPDELPVT